MTNSLKECTNDSVLTGGFFPLLHHYFTYFPKAQTGYNKMNRPGECRFAITLIRIMYDGTVLLTL